MTLTAEHAHDQSVASRFLERRGLAGVVFTPVVFWDRLIGVLEFGSATAAGLQMTKQVAPVAADLLAVALGATRSSSTCSVAVATSRSSWRRASKTWLA